MSLFHNSIEEDRRWYVHVHADLNRLHDFLARRSTPMTYDAPGCEEVAAVMQLVEDLTNSLPKPNKPTL